MKKPSYKQLQNQIIELKRRVTEQEQRKHEEEERYQALFAGINDAVFVHKLGKSRPGLFIEVNDAACRRLGYSREELLQLSPPDINSRLNHTVTVEILARIKAEGSHVFEAVHLSKDGRDIFVEINAHLCHINGEDAIISIARDITDRKIWENKLQQTNDELESWIVERSGQLRKSKEQYKRLVEEIPGILYLYSDKLGGVFYSSKVETILGFSEESFLNNSDLWLSSVHPDDRKMVAEAVEKLKYGKDFDLEYRIKDALGQWHWFNDRLIGRRKKGDETIIEGLAIDITAQKKGEEEREKLLNQLRETQKMEALGTLAGGIAHDFNNILAAIIGYSEMLADSLGQNVDASLMINEILVAGNRAKELTKQILAFSRQGTGERRTIQIHKVVKEAVQMMYATIPKSIQFETDINANCGYVQADATQIHQMVVNLCTNAYHAMHRMNSGTLRVSLEPVDGKKNNFLQELDDRAKRFVKLTVSDSGHGMNKSVMERVFDPYFTTKKKGEGTGLGLSVVLGIVNNHGGVITVDSGPGTGTTFDVYLPGLDEQKINQEEAPDFPLIHGNEHILFVDDEDVLVQLGNETLKRLGYKVTCTTSSLEALEIFKQDPEHFHLVITDMIMPNMSGAELTKRLLEIKADLPVILCTGYSDAISDARAKQVGFKGYLMKPIVMKELSKAVRSALAQGTP